RRPGPPARGRGLVHDGRAPRAARHPLPGLRDRPLPPRGGVVPQPPLRGRPARGGRAVPPGPGVVLHRRPLPAAAALRPPHRTPRALRAGGGRARGRGAGRAGPGGGRLRGRGPAGRRPGRAGGRDALRRRGRHRAHDLAVEAGRGRRRRRRGGGAVSREVLVVGAGMHPWGKWGRPFQAYGVHAARAALADAGLDWTDVQLVVGGETVRNGYPGYVAGATFARALGWSGARVATAYAACATGAQALDTARARILAGLCDVALVVGADTTPKGFLAPNAGERWDDPDWLRFRLLGATNPTY